MKRIKVKIDGFGRPTIEAEGYNGVGCAEATASIEKALSGGVVSAERVMKPEWHQTETETEDEGVRMTW